MTQRTQYDPVDFDAMLADPVRTPAYLAAIAKVVRAGDVVVEIGAGTGYFSVAAARAGARRVFAIERGASAALAEEIVRENGCADRVTVVHGDAATAELPERGNVLLFDLSGWLPLNADAIPCVIAVRERLLVPGARLISRRDTIFAAPCTAPRRWAERELALGDAPFGIRRSVTARLARSMVHREHVPRTALAAPEQAVHVIEYATVTSPDVDAELEWRIAQDGGIHGIILWFDTDLADGVGFSTRPEAPPNVYGQPFLPFEQVIDARAGDVLRCRVRMRLYGTGYLYAWDTTFTPAGAGRETTVMRQSTLAATLALSGEALAAAPLAAAPTRA